MRHRVLTRPASAKFDATQRCWIQPSRGRKSEQRQFRVYAQLSDSRAEPFNIDVFPWFNRVQCAS
jgi:hypothetical protein